MKNFFFYALLFCSSSVFAISTDEAPLCSLKNSVTARQPLKPLFFFSDLTPEIYLQRLATRLAGSTLNMNSIQYKKVLQFLRQKKYYEGAEFLTRTENFLSIRVRSFASPYASKDFSNSETFNDLQALFVGVIRDNLDARLLLTGNLRYQGAFEPAPSLENNLHYIQLGNELMSSLIAQNKQWENYDTAAGVFTTRAWASVNYEAGTNRRSVKNAFDLFLCAPIDSWKYRGVPDHFVRRDVDRVPGGQPSTYQNTCRNCHGIMDGMGGAFAHFNFNADGKFLFTPRTVMDKMNQNGNVYPPGFVTTDSSWVNLITYNTSIDFGWRTSLEGTGILDFANMLAESKAFSQCWVEKIFAEICGGSVGLTNPALKEQLTSEFESGGRNLRLLFAKIASHPLCIAHPQP